MKKVKFKHSGRALYALLCVGLLAVGVASVAGYRAAVNSVTDGLITPSDEGELPDLDYSEVDAILSDVEKIPAPTTQNEPVLGLDPVIPPILSPENGQTPSDPALLDITDELEALYYEQAVMMPVNGEILNPYSEGELVKSSGGVWRTHDGIDIAAAEGTEVKAMTAGTVTEVYEDPLWGCCVVVDHGNAMSGCYYGLSPDLRVTVGDVVNAGDQIGSVGSTADIESDIGPHLHFALRYADNWIDPVQYIEPMK